MCETIKVNSTAISEVTYDYNTHILTIQFVRGAEYAYPDVPVTEFQKLVSAPSVGKYFNTHIKQYGVR